MNDSFPEVVTVFDLNQPGYPNQKHDQFRSLQVFVCPVCDARSNLVQMEGSMHGYGACVVCPMARECWHHVLGYWQHRIQHETIASVAVPVIERFRRKFLSRVRQDVVGDVDLTQLRAMTHVTGYRKGTFCRHVLGGDSTTTWDERDLEYSQALINQVERLGVDRDFEERLQTVGSAHHDYLRRQFYGDDAWTLLFPTATALPFGGSFAPTVPPEAVKIIDDLRKWPWPERRQRYRVLDQEEAKV